MEYENINKSINDIINECPKSMQNAILRGNDIHIDSISFSYAGLYSILMPDGKLYIKTENSNPADDDADISWYLFNLFAEPDTINLDNISVVTPSIESQSPKLEATHRLVLYKDSDNKYYAKPIKFGSDNNRYYYSLDVDKIKNADLDTNTGLFISTNEINIVDTFYVLNKSLLYVNIITPLDDQSEIKIYIENATASESVKNGKNYFNIISNDDDYIEFKLVGNGSTPEQILLEVF